MPAWRRAPHFALRGFAIARLRRTGGRTEFLHPTGMSLDFAARNSGGRGGIRTHGTFYRSLDFESSAFDRTQPPFLEKLFTTTRDNPCHRRDIQIRRGGRSLGPQALPGKEKQVSFDNNGPPRAPCSHPVPWQKWWAGQGYPALRDLQFGLRLKRLALRVRQSRRNNGSGLGGTRTHNQRLKRATPFIDYQRFT